MDRRKQAIKFLLTTTVLWGCGATDGTKKVQDIKGSSTFLSGDFAQIATYSGEITNCISGLNFTFVGIAPNDRLDLISGDENCVVEISEFEAGGQSFQLDTPPFNPAVGQSNWFIAQSNERVKLVNQAQLPSPINPSINVAEFQLIKPLAGQDTGLIAGPVCVLLVSRPGQVNGQKTRITASMTEDYIRQSSNETFYPCGAANTGSGCDPQQSKPKQNKVFQHRYTSSGPFNVEVQVSMDWGETLSCVLSGVTIP
jgi:hypothetical protein